MLMNKEGFDDSSFGIPAKTYLYISHFNLKVTVGLSFYIVCVLINNRFPSKNKINKN